MPPVHLSCMAGSSAGTSVPGLTETDGVALRGTLPSCSPLPCALAGRGGWQGP